MHLDCVLGSTSRCAGYLRPGGYLAQGMLYDMQRCVRQQMGWGETPWGALRCILRGAWMRPPLPCGRLWARERRRPLSARLCVKRRPSRCRTANRTMLAFDVRASAQELWAMTMTDTETLAAFEVVCVAVAQQVQDFKPHVAGLRHARGCTDALGHSQDRHGNAHHLRGFVRGGGPAGAGLQTARCWPSSCALLPKHSGP